MLQNYPKQTLQGRFRLLTIIIINMDVLLFDSAQSKTAKKNVKRHKNNAKRRKNDAKQCETTRK